MPRHARIILPDHPHHLVLRGNNRRRLFSYHHERRRFLYLVGRALRLGGCRLHALTLMTNHVHLVVTPDDKSAACAFVKLLAQCYAQHRNLARNGSGKLFDARYFSVPILDDRQLGITLAYVDLNPVRAGMTADAASYRWSTYALHAGGLSEIPAGLWTPSAWYLALGDDVATRQRQYREWVASCAASDARPEALTRELLLEHERAARGDRIERPDRSSAS